MDITSLAFRVKATLQGSSRPEGTRFRTKAAAPHKLNALESTCPPASKTRHTGTVAHLCWPGSSPGGAERRRTERCHALESRGVLGRSRYCHPRRRAAERACVTRSCTSDAHRRVHATQNTHALVGRDPRPRGCTVTTGGRCRGNVDTPHARRRRSKTQSDTAAVSRRAASICPAAAATVVIHTTSPQRDD